MTREKASVAITGAVFLALIGMCAEWLYLKKKSVKDDEVAEDDILNT